jgi:hypothetical protein
METKKLHGWLPAVIFMCAVMIFIGCETADPVKQMKDDLAVLDGITSGALLIPAPKDTAVLITYGNSGIRRDVKEDELPRIPIPPDRLYGYSEIYTFACDRCEGASTVLKSRVTAEGQVKLFNRMAPGEEYILIKCSGEKIAETDSTLPILDRMKLDLSLLKDINASTFVTPAPPDTAVLITYGNSGIHMDTEEDELPRIPIPPDRLYGYSAIYTFKSGQCDGLITVLKSTVTAGGQMKLFQKMMPGDITILIKYFNKKDTAKTGAGEK